MTRPFRRSAIKQPVSSWSRRAKASLTPTGPRPCHGRIMYPSLCSATIPGNSASTRRTVVSSSGLVATAAHSRAPPGQDAQSSGSGSRHRSRGFPLIAQRSGARSLIGSVVSGAIALAKLWSPVRLSTSSWAITASILSRSLDFAQTAPASGTLVISSRLNTPESTVSRLPGALPPPVVSSGQKSAVRVAVFSRQSGRSGCRAHHPGSRRGNSSARHNARRNPWHAPPGHATATAPMAACRSWRGPAYQRVGGGT